MNQMSLIQNRVCVILLCFLLGGQMIPWWHFLYWADGHCGDASARGQDHPEQQPARQVPMPST